MCAPHCVINIIVYVQVIHSTRLVKRPGVSTSNSNETEKNGGAARMHLGNISETCCRCVFGGDFWVRMTVCSHDCVATSISTLTAPTSEHAWAAPAVAETVDRARSRLEDGVNMCCAIWAP